MFPQAGKADFDYLEKKVKEWGEPKVASAKQVTKPLYLPCSNKGWNYLAMYITHEFSLSQLIWDILRYMIIDYFTLS